jgi:hypothetical protein
VFLSTGNRMIARREMIRAVGTATQADRRQPRHRGPTTVSYTADQRAWIRARTRIGWQIDELLKTRPPIEVRRAVRQLEHAMACGDHAVGL